MQTPFDAIAKDLLEGALAPAGTVQTHHEVHSASQFADVWFEPDPARAAARETMGLLGRMVDAPCLFEPFHDPPSPDDVRACLRKLLALDHRRAGEAAKKREPRPPLPRLWVLSSARPNAVLRLFGLQKMTEWPRGFFRAADGLGLWVVVLRELPRERDTLLLRLMGAGRVLTEALEETVRLPEDAMEREVGLPAVLAHLKTIKQDPASEGETSMWAERVAEAREFVRKAREEGMQAGLQQGVHAGRVQDLIAVYAARFGSVPDVIVAAVESAHDAVLRQWIAPFSTADAEAIAKLVASSPPDE